MRVALFAGSGEGTTRHRDAVAALATTLAREGHEIVYGGGRVGLMGLLADSALNTGGAVIGVMPRHLVDREIAHATLTRLEVVDDMHQRKARMMALADAFVALPGGAGTLEEIFEAWTWGQLGLHAKPCALYNIDGFYTPLLEQLDGMNTAGYLGEQHRSALGACSTPEALLGFLATYEHPASKWTDSAHPSAR